MCHAGGGDPGFVQPDPQPVVFDPFENFRVHAHGAPVNREDGEKVQHGFNPCETTGSPMLFQSPVHGSEQFVSTDDGEEKFVIPGRRRKPLLQTMEKNA